MTDLSRAKGTYYDGKSEVKPRRLICCSTKSILALTSTLFDSKLCTLAFSSLLILRCSSSSFLVSLFSISRAARVRRLDAIILGLGPRPKPLM